MPKLQVALLIAATAIALLPVCAGEFVTWDDGHNLINNPAMNGPALTGIAWHWAHAYKDLYIPVTYTVWGLIAQFAGTTAPGGGHELNSYVFHSLNLALHLVAAVIVFAILRRLFPTGWAACCGAMVFALHPVQVEAVAWVSGMKDLLAGLLGLGAVLLYIDHAVAAQHGRRRRALALWAAGGGLLILAMLSKPSAVTIPLVVAGIDVLLLRRSFRSAILPAGGWLLLGVPIIYIAKIVQPASPLTFIPPLWFRSIVAADALAFYITQLIWPLSLGIDYGRSPLWLWSSKQIYVTWAVPVAITIAAIAWRRRMPYFAAGVIVFIAAVAPVLGFVPFDFQAYSTVTDHYLYAAMLGVSIIVAGALSCLPPWAMRICFIAIVLLAVRSHLQAWVWHDSLSLFQHAVKVNPISLPGRLNLGSAYADEEKRLRAIGMTDEAHAMADRAIEWDRKALEISPHDPAAHYNLGQMYSLQHRWADAEAEYRAAIRDGDTASDTRTALGAVLANQQRFDEAIEQFNLAVKMNPDDDLARSSIARALRAKAAMERGARPPG